MKKQIHILCDELYPYFEVAENDYNTPDKVVFLSEKTIKNYKKIHEKWYKMQTTLGKLYYNAKT